MIVNAHLCLTPTKGWISDGDQDDKPMLLIEFVNDLKDESREDKQRILDTVAEATQKMFTVRDDY